MAVGENEWKSQDPLQWPAIGIALWIKYKSLQRSLIQRSL